MNAFHTLREVLRLPGEAASLNAVCVLVDEGTHVLSLDGLFDFLESYRETPVLVNHGDRCAAFATELRDEGYEASAPELGETVSV